MTVLAEHPRTGEATLVLPRPGVVMYRLTVPGEPIAKARARVTRHGTYTPKSTVKATERVQEAAAEAWPGVEPYPGPWSLVVRFYRRHRHRRDVDNLAKLVMDALNGVLWEDDHQVMHLDAAMEFVETDPRTTIQAYSRLMPTQQDNERN